MNHKLWNIVSSEIYIYIYTPYAGAAGMLLHINGKFTMGYPIELEIKDTTDTDKSTSCVDLHLELDSEGRLGTKRYDKRDDLNFPIVNFQFICSNIPAAPGII
jgi:hypothetical protein